MASYATDDEDHQFEEIDIPFVGEDEDEDYESDLDKEFVGKVYEDMDPLAASTSRNTENEASNSQASKLPKKHKCPMAGCEKTFSRKEHVTSHLDQVHRPKVPCPLIGCNRYIRPRYLKHHLQRYHDEQKETCTNCSKKVPKAELEDHIEECYGEEGRQFRCTFEGCNKAFFTERYRNRHRADVHEPSVKCPYDGCASVVKPKYLVQHVDLVHKKLKATCPNCNKDYLCASLSAHRKRCLHKKDIRYPCVTCKEVFLTVDERRIHVKKAHYSVYVTCPYEDCGMSLMKKSLSKHIKNSHEKIKGVCNTCGGEFIKSSLWKHERSCNKNMVREFKCEIDNCGATFVRYSGLCVHMKLSKHGEKAIVSKRRKMLVPEVEIGEEENKEGQEDPKINEMMEDSAEEDEELSEEEEEEKAKEQAEIKEEEQMLNIVIVGEKKEIPDPLRLIDNLNT